jgi:hypothetical protein
MISVVFSGVCHANRGFLSDSGASSGVVVRRFLGDLYIVDM